MTMMGSLNRRNFIKLTGSAGAGLMIGVYVPVLRRFGTVFHDSQGVFAPNVWLRITRSGDVTVTVAKSEMGQGVLTSLPMIVAEELDVDWSRVRFEHPVADKKYGSMGTGGSSSVRRSFDNLRYAGAAARMMLIAAAAQMWGVDPSACTTEAGAVHHRSSGRSLHYGKLVDTAATMSIPGKITLKDPRSFHIIGRRTLRLDVPSKVDGSAGFGIDTRVPGMLYGTVLHSPVFGGKVKLFDAVKAQAIAGVRKVVEIPTGVAVIADSTWAAFRGRDALSVNWDEGENGNVSSASIRASLVEASARRGAVAEQTGDVRAALASAPKKIEAIYEAPFLAHATMEPMNATADVRADSCEIWAPTQSPQGAQQDAATFLSIDPSRVIVHTTFLGGGFGRRFSTDFIMDAIHCSRAAGAPVKVTWTREEDMQHDVYRPVSRHLLSGAIDSGGRLTALSHTVVAPSMSDQRRPGSLRNGLDRSAVEGTTNLPYAIPNVLVEYVLAPTPIPIGPWRSVYPSQNVYALECFIDELAAVAGRDPLEFRLELSAKSPRTHAVLKLAAEKSNWGKPLPRGYYRGIACGPHAFYGSYVAQVAEVSVTADSTVRLHRVVCAIDCGIAVNPETIEGQMEGAIVYGLSAALKGEITIDRGRTVQGNFDDYPLLTIDEMPAIEVYIVPSMEAPEGIGEPGLPPIAPAVLNAVFAATGKRIRRLPIRLRA
jgi:isoquinoline 1-oxidoreductase beta subunit